MRQGIYREAVLGAGWRSQVLHGGHSDDAGYARWRNMVGRCHNPTDASYPRYGGRGIAVCDAWRESYETFAAEIGEPPTPLHTLDRINNDGNYEPGNVRWATSNEQARNRRRSLFVELDGERMHVKAAADRLGIGYYTLRNRIRNGIPLRMPLMRGRPKRPYAGE